jgi:HEAT repeat protein
MRSCPLVLSGVLLLAACGTARPDLYRPGEPTPEQKERLRRFETAWRKGEPESDALRAELAQDPVTACWLTRLFVRDVMASREGREPGRDRQLLRSAAGMDDPVETRALAQLDALGAAAVPCLVEDLCKHRQGYVRQLGVELLGRIGAPALPGLQPLVAGEDAVGRRTAAQALGAMPPSDATLALLRGLAHDGDFTVRAAAAQSLAPGGPGAAELLRNMLAAEADPFVRRSAALALGRHREPESATALIDYLERCKRELDPQGEIAAQDALQALAQSRGPRSAEAWRNWARTFDPARGEAAAARPGNR